MLVIVDTLSLRDGITISGIGNLHARGQIYVETRSDDIRCILRLNVGVRGCRVDDSQLP